MKVQQKFFEMAKSRLLPSQRLVDVICKTLNMTSDSAYRRIRGEKELSLTELADLCHHFNMSFDALINYKSDNILFRYAPLDLSKMDNYYTYTDNLLNLFNTISKTVEKEICFMALDIPGPHFMPFLDLMLFKLYSWFRSQNESQLSYEGFVSQLDLPRLSAVFKKIENAYRQIPSTEIWTVHTIDPLLKQLACFCDMHCFEHKETFHRICHQAVQLVDNIERYTLNGEKEYHEQTATFRLYLSTVDITNDFMIAKYNGLHITSIKLYTINGIFTSNESFYEEVEKWMKDTMGKSFLLSGASARERFRFFHEMKDKIYKLSGNFEKWPGI